MEQKLKVKDLFIDGFFQIVSNDWIKVWIIGNIILDKIKIAIEAETNTIYYNV